MGRIVNAALHEAWRVQIAQQAASGLTVSAFCNQAGVSEHSFYRWRRRLSELPQGDQSASQPASQPGRSTGVVVSWCLTRAIRHGHSPAASFAFLWSPTVDRAVWK